MDSLLVNGDEIELTPDPPWRWMVPPVRLTVSALPGHRMKAKGQFVIWESEILTAGLQAAGQLYSAPGFDTPGSVLTVTLMVTPGTMSAAVKDLKQPVATVGTKGTFMASVVPAINPGTGVPDPLVIKTGTWAVASEVQSIARSGQPAGNAQGGDDAVAAVGSRGGANNADVTSGESAMHFVAIVVEDVDGNKLAEHRVAIATPDGRRSAHTLTSAGAARVDNIRADGEAIVQLLDAEIRSPVKRPTPPWIAFTVIDEDGQPLEGVNVELTTPDGATLVVRTGPKGAVRVDNLKQDGECTVRVLTGEGDETRKGDDTRRGRGDGRNVEPLPNESGTDVETPDDDAKRSHVVEMDGALFRLESAVVLPEGEDPSSEQHQALSSVGAFATVLRFNEENAGKKLFVAGHADTSGGEEFNLQLSDERAECALAVLTGDRSLFTQIAQARHRISDYKQILSWCTRAFPQLFNCDPGENNDKEFPGVAPLKLFQAQYNAAKTTLGVAGPDIAVDGSIGEETWGAIFDVYEFALRDELGEDEEGIAALRAKVTFVDNQRKALGFGEYHPVDDPGDSTRSQPNRRIEMLLFDEGEEPDLVAAEEDPRGSELYTRGTYIRERLELFLPSAIVEVRLCSPSGDPMPHASFEARVGSRSTTGVADGDGVALVEASGAAKSVTISWSAGSDDGPAGRFEREAFLRLGEGDEATQRRLDNLGYLGTASSLEDKLLEYRSEFGRQESLDVVIAELATWHDGADRPSANEAESPEQIAESPEEPANSTSPSGSNRPT